MNKTTDLTKTREEEYAEETTAILRESYETFCEEKGLDSESEEAEDAFRHYILSEQEQELIDAADSLAIEEYQWRMQDEQDYRDANWE